MSLNSPFIFAHNVHARACDIIVGYTKSTIPKNPLRQDEIKNLMKFYQGGCKEAIVDCFYHTIVCAGSQIESHI